MNLYNDIRVLREIDGSRQWIPAPPDWTEAYIQYKMHSIHSIHGNEIPFNFNDQFIVYREQNNCYMPTRIQQSDTGDTHAIMDCADVKVFIQDAEPVNWQPAHNYQMWAFRDFMYDPLRPARKHYASKYSSHIFFQRGSAKNVIYIDIDGLPPNIIFSISRNANGSVYYERNDMHGTRVRICDHEGARAEFRAVYARMTMDPIDIMTQTTTATLPIPIPSQSHSMSYADPLPLPAKLDLCKTNVEEEQCILCYENKKNVAFRPCDHIIMCSECYTKLINSRECPICKQEIISLVGHT